uniref:RNase H type-1 domain-containing protein n=1 Tax=Fagus sylvatica TaxID=28930 RepID=A0A2N9FG05_FAGSY
MHSEKDCNVWLRNQETLRREDQEYSGWMRAGMDHPLKKFKVVISGCSNTKKGSLIPTAPKHKLAKTPNPKLVRPTHGDSDDDMEWINHLYPAEKNEAVKRMKTYLRSGTSKAKLLVFTKRTFYRRRLWYSPTEANELPKLELSWAWEPRDNSGAREPCAGKRSLSRVPDRNMVKVKIFRNHSLTGGCVVAYRALWSPRNSKKECNMDTVATPKSCTPTPLCDPRDRTRGQRKPFHFEEMWMEDKGYEETIFIGTQRAWNGNVLAFETLHHMHSTKIKHEGVMALKLNMSKAYDWVEWGYLEKLMDKKVYETASGQQVNRAKTIIYFSKGTLKTTKSLIQTALGVPIIKQYEEYLGLPSLVGRNRKFNAALLGKQVLRLYQDPTALLHRVYKAKFFPEGSILDASSKTKGSYAWQSIIKARDFILRGLVWRVGNGSSIKIWRHRWLPEESHRQVLSPIPELLRNNVSYLEEFMQCNDIQDVGATLDRTQVKWFASSNCRFKINYDGAVFQERNKASIGVVIRDEQGLPLASMTKKIRYPHSVEGVEALAARSTIQFALDIGIQEGEVEGDSTTIVNAFKTDCHCHAPFGLAIEATKTLSDQFTKIQFNHVKRQGNALAHALARHAQHCFDFEVWMEYVPSTLEHLLSLNFPS